VVVKLSHLAAVGWGALPALPGRSFFFRPFIGTTERLHESRVCWVLVFCFVSVVVMAVTGSGYGLFASLPSFSSLGKQDVHNTDTHTHKHHTAATCSAQNTHTCGQHRTTALSAPDHRAQRYSLKHPSIRAFEHPNSILAILATDGVSHSLTPRSGTVGRFRYLVVSQHIVC
jgi:hypothetical protein